jgi:hypothetical protein
MPKPPEKPLDNCRSWERHQTTRRGNDYPWASKSLLAAGRLSSERFGGDGTPKVTVHDKLRRTGVLHELIVQATGQNELNHR